MIIDFDKITEEHIEGFKGGEGKLDVRAFVDDQARIMYSTLRPGANSGKHQHVGSFEVMYVISGELTVHYDDTTEVARVGQFTLLSTKDTSIGLKTVRTTMSFTLLSYQL